MDASRVSVAIPHHVATSPALTLQLMLARPYEIIVSDHCSPMPFPTTDDLVLNSGSGADVNSGAAIAAEDLRLVLKRRLARLGLRRVHLPHVAVTHEGGGSSDPAKRRRWLVADQLRYARKWGGARRLQAALSLATVANFVWNCTRRIRGIAVSPVGTAREELGLIWRSS